MESDESESEEVSDRAELLKGAMLKFSPKEVELEARAMDIKERRCVEEFMAKGCGCRKWGGKMCSKQFDVAYVEDMRMDFMTMTTTHLDLFLMGELIASCDTTSITSGVTRHIPQERSSTYSTGTKPAKSAGACSCSFGRSDSTMS
jgi:hypothetical protein